MKKPNVHSFSEKYKGNRKASKTMFAWLKVSQISHDDANESAALFYTVPQTNVTVALSCHFVLN
jgi:hypothetical protein